MRFQGYFGIFLCIKGILVIFHVSGGISVIFWVVEVFQLFFKFMGVSCPFFSLRGISVILMIIKLYFINFGPQVSSYIFINYYVLLIFSIKLYFITFNVGKKIPKSLLRRSLHLLRWF